MSITFQVSQVERARAPLTIPAPDEAPRLQGRPVEAMGATAPFLPSAGHGLVHAVHLAYADHRPLALSPDAIWLALAQGFAPPSSVLDPRDDFRLRRADFVDRKSVV